MNQSIQPPSGGNISNLLERITPVILCYNEAPNIGRVLEKIKWARDIVVVDSFSNDETPEIVKRYPQARFFRRAFDRHANQWNFAIQETGIQSDWILALDSDFILTEELFKELKQMQPAPDISGYAANFRYCVYGNPLRGSVYPRVTVLYRRGKGSYIQDGHTERVVVDGIVKEFQAFMFHDDHKRLSRWFISQYSYARLEAEKILKSGFLNLNWADRIRKLRFVAPLAVLFYCFVLKGLILDGRVGFFYTFQRFAAEIILSLYLLDHDIKRIFRGDELL